MKTAVDGDKITMDDYWTVPVLTEKMFLEAEIYDLGAIHSCNPMEC